MNKFIFPAISILGALTIAGLQLLPDKKHSKKITLKPILAPTVSNTPTKSPVPVEFNQTLPKDQEKIYIIDDDQDKFTNKIGVFEGMEQKYNDGLYKGRVRVGTEYTTLDHLAWAPVSAIKDDMVSFSIAVACIRAQRAAERRSARNDQTPFGGNLN